MSIPVPLDELDQVIGRFPSVYLLSVSEQQAPRANAVAPTLVDGRFVVGVGRTTAQHLAVHPKVTLLWPTPAGEEMALIVDGTVTVDGQQATITPTWAVLHQTVNRST